MVLLKRRLGVERVDLAGSAVHEQEDHVLGPRREMGRLGRHQIRLRFVEPDPRARFALPAPTREKPRSRQEVDQAQAGKAAADLPEKLAGATGRTASDWGMKRDEPLPDVIGLPSRSNPDKQTRSC